MEIIKEAEELAKLVEKANALTKELEQEIGVSGIKTESIVLYQACFIKVRHGDNAGQLIVPAGELGKFVNIPFGP